jgi:Subtilase family
MIMTKKSNSSRKKKQGEMGYRPRVVVKFHDYVELPYEDGVEKHIEELSVGPWRKLKEKFPDLTIKRLYTSLDPNEIKKLVDSATELDPTYSPPNLLTYFRIDVPPDFKPQALAEALLSWQSVQTAYFDPPGEDPVVSPGDDPRFGSQGYLDPAPDGIDAEFAWPRPDGTGFPGGDGAGQRVIDFERGWTLSHEDLTDHGAALLHGSIRNGSRFHGTSVLGQICAVDNTIGCIGIAPEVASVNAVSYWGSTRPNALLAAIANLSFGDVLLLEAQVSLFWGDPYLPIEVLDAEFDTIRLATALGIIVVEAAGNGDRDLDAYTDGAGNSILNRTAGAGAGFRDSGAIMVGAATSTVPHRRMDKVITSHWPVPWGSNFGSRIDCYGWGEDVDTCSSNDAGSTTLYTTSFNGTSSASPIVTGAALIVQGIAENPASGPGYRFSPRQLREILSDPDPVAGNTPSNNPAVDRIGVMPNLRAIIENVLNLSPDVYIRDFVGDIGDPHADSISASPDIILLPETVADPQTSYGEGSGTENSNTLGADIEEGEDGYLYVRVRNRGGSPAADVVATVFWAPVATLLTSDLWTLVGSTTIPNVPETDELTVSDAIHWPAADIPGLGHYCFVGLIGNAEDPGPEPADFLDWDNYYRFIRENNNVTWRNFNVVPNEPDPEAGDPSNYVGLAFLAPGAPDKARRMQLEVVARLPKGARAFLEMPLHFADAIQEHSPFLKINKKGNMARLPVNPHGRKRLKEVLFPTKSRTRMRLLVHIPKKMRRKPYEVYVRQLYEGTEVGRVTWRLAPRDRKPPFWHKKPKKR